MKTFAYTIRDELGIHARPAGQLVSLAKSFSSAVTIENNGKCVNMTKLFMLMGMGVKCGDTVNVSAEGADEENAIGAIENFMRTNL